MNFSFCVYFLIQQSQIKSSTMWEIQMVFIGSPASDNSVPWLVPLSPWGDPVRSSLLCFKHERNKAQTLLTTVIAMNVLHSPLFPIWLTAKLPAGWVALLLRQPQIVQPQPNLNLKMTEQVSTNVCRHALCWHDPGIQHPLLSRPFPLWLVPSSDQVRIPKDFPWWTLF